MAEYSSGQELPWINWNEPEGWNGKTASSIICMQPHNVYSGQESQILRQTVTFYEFTRMWKNLISKVSDSA